ncbi:unnamed protein product [Lathyrus oleraceus]
MKCLYWNIMGISNSPSKLALKDFLSQCNPDFYLIVEPWMNHSSFPIPLWNRLNLKFFVVNNINFSLPNLWCICNCNLDPQIQSSSDQHVTFTVLIDNILISIVVVYASTCHIKRRSLWEDISSCTSSTNIPWCLIGDYNSILRAHEHKEAHNPFRTPM